MIVVRMEFQAKWNQSDRVVAGFTENADLMRKILGPEIHMRILTDLSGPFFTVVQEFEVPSLAEWERVRTKIFTNPEIQEAVSEIEDNPFMSGRTEYYTLEAAY
ncbi:MAG: hypothetical protein ACK2UW_12210 [Anaerolineales bacterium]